MPEDGSPRPRPMRRLLLAMARAVILLILITGIHGVLAIAFPRTPAVNRAVAAFVIGVIIFETLRATRRSSSSAIGTDNENALERERARASSLDGRLASVLQEVEELRGERMKLEKLATGHENDLRDAIAARDAARAELRSVTGKLRDVEQGPEPTPAI